MVAQADICAVHRVDQVKVPPHEPITAIHLVKSTLQNAAPRVKIPAGTHAILVQILRTHVSRLKGNAIVAVLVVQPPRIIKQPPFRFQSPIQRRAGKWGQMIESGDIYRACSLANATVFWNASGVSAS